MEVTDLTNKQISIISLLIALYPIISSFYPECSNVIDPQYNLTSQEVEEIMTNHPGFVKAMWCGSEDCEMKMKEIRGTKSRCILEHDKPIDDKCIVCGKEAKDLVVWGIQY